jgi:2-keto-4-pentenoate hydratase/2-oxohepta-3-ene-1,7-dioic acid hydratase in catechol pathway
MIWNSFELIAFISRFVTLEPGDLIATGTPAGVGMVEQRFLQDGDLVEGEIQGLGRLSNPVKARSSE